MMQQICGVPWMLRGNLSVPHNLLTIRHSLCKYVDWTWIYLYWMEICTSIYFLTKWNQNWSWKNRRPWIIIQQYCDCFTLYLVVMDDQVCCGWGKRSIKLLNISVNNEIKSCLNSVQVLLTVYCHIWMNVIMVTVCIS